ncbi:DNA-directed DNA polymerase [Caerostris extrusa]|uniref:DNA-directed DNA polymerase n=1 Tax=Caerostris extrusa TaxID=172846 RepID=A0AAV4V480_CAEEX|nr:DNA-directed DNA polymerase [Caerostris extrusa]
MKNRNRPALKKRAQELHEAAGVPLGPCTFQEVQIFEDHLNIQIVVFSADNLNQVTYKGKERPLRINLWHHDNHYDVIKSVKGFFGSNYYCENCEKPYSSCESHRCPKACYICLRMSCPPGQPQRCKDCDRLCVSESCYQAHKTVTGKKEKSLCDKIYQCRMCCKVIKRNECRQELHRCGTTKSCENFCAWLFTPEHKGFTAIAHNMKGFDGQFIMAWILKQGMTPDVIPNGGLIMSILHPSLKIRIIDSLNFLPMPLSKIPDCFGFKELRKGYFPHLFNIKQNQNYEGAFPEARFYSPDSMGPAVREKFLIWYEDQKNKTFNFQEEMVIYCRSDVDILRRCCLEFRGQFQEITQVDPFQYVTIASACMAVFRSLHVTPNTIAMVPIHGYVNDIRYSPDSIRWLDFVSHNENIVILHALNGTGEKKFMEFL